MDISSVNGAVSDALAGLPAGTSSFINANIGTPEGQQAILQAGLSLGLSQSQIAAAISQATGMSVTPQQVAQVAQSVAAPAPTPAPVSAPTPAVNQPFTSSNPGGVGVSYGQAGGGLISQAQSQYPELATALANGTLSLGSSGDENYLYNTKTGQQINGNYQISTTPSGGVAINLPLSSGAMVQVATGLNQNGTLAPVTDSNVYNVGLNSSEGGFAGGVSNFTDAAKAGALLYGGSQLLSGLTGAGAATGAGTALSDVGAGTAATTGAVGGEVAGAGTTGAAGTGTIGAGTAGVVGAGTLASTGAGTGAATGAATGAGTAAATNALGLTPLQTAAAGVGLASTLGTLGTNNAISNAANTQATAANNVNDVLGGFYNQYAQAEQPYQNLGSGAVSEIGKQAPYLTHQFNAADLQAGLAPNYDFMLQQGQGANRNLANAGGGLLSGNTLQGLNKYTQDYASNAYQNAFNNYQTQRQNIYGNLSNAAGLGQTSLGQVGQVGSNLAQTYGNVTTGLAASQAGAQTAQAVNNANLLSNLAKTGTVIALA